MNERDIKPGYNHATIGKFGHWITPEYYQNLQDIDGYSLSDCAAKYIFTGEIVIIRKLIYPRFVWPLTQSNLFKTFYNILFLLKSVKHKNILDLFDLFIPYSNIEGRDNIYIVSKFYGIPIDRCLIKNVLTDDHIQCIIYQMLCVLKYLHSAGIICKSLCPRDFIINENCDIKLLPFELIPEKFEYNDKMCSPPFGDKRYQAPELLYQWEDPTPKADIWSIGCIMAELITGKPLFPAFDIIEYFDLHTSLMGSFDDEKIVSRMKSELAKEFIRRQPKKERKNFAEYFSTATSEAVDFLEKALVVDSDYRMSVDEALAHPYFSQYRDPLNEPTRDRIEIDTNDYSDEEWKEKLFNLINDFQEKRKMELKPYFDSNGEYYCLKMKPQEKLIL